MVGIIGAGNVAMDAARSAIRLGAKKVYILYRRTKKEAPAREEEIQYALGEGVIFKGLVAPKKVIGDDDGWLKKEELFKMELGEVDKSGRPRPLKVEGSEFRMKLNTFVEALGTKPNMLFLSRAPELEVDPWGLIKVDENLKTNVEGVYAGGGMLLLFLLLEMEERRQNRFMRGYQKRELKENNYVYMPISEIDSRI